jgi:hypothetical protein
MRDLDPLGDDAGFEARLAAAYRSYLDEVPTEVDAAAVAHTVARRTTRQATWLPARPLDLVRILAWLAVLALVVAGFAGTGLFVGSSPGPEPSPLAACPPGTDPDAPGPADQVRPSTAWPWSRAAFDRGSGRIVLVAAATPAGTPLETWTFDVCTNSWSRMSAQGGPGGRANWVDLVYDAGSDLTIAFDEDGGVRAYDLETDTWTPRQAMSADVARTEYGGSRFVYEPASDLVFDFAVARAGGIRTYDVDTDTWVAAGVDGSSPSGPPDHRLTVLDGSLPGFVSFDAASGRTKRLDPQAVAWTPGSYGLPVNTGFFASGGEIAYDEAARRTVVFSDGVVVAYDARADTWETLDQAPRDADGMPQGPRARLGHSMVYDPWNERIVVLGGSARLPDGWRDADDVLAFDMATRAWTVLLPPGEPYPPAASPSPSPLEG